MSHRPNAIIIIVLAPTHIPVGTVIGRSGYTNLMGARIVVKSMLEREHDFVNTRQINSGTDKTRDTVELRTVVQQQFIG